MARIITDFETWLIDESDTRIFRYLVYKKVYTPHEQDKKYSDESEYEDGGIYTLAKIEEAVDMGNGNWMLGMREIFEDGSIAHNLKYVMLNEIRLYSFDEDQDIELWDDSDSLDETIDEDDDYYDDDPL
jgi:hypothetical protein